MFQNNVLHSKNTCETHSAVERLLDGFVIVEPGNSGLGVTLDMALELELVTSSSHQIT